MELEHPWVEKRANDNGKGKRCTKSVYRGRVTFQDNLQEETE